MATLVCFHAHPDDESIATGGTMLLASQAGHRVVLVMATKGEQGEPNEGILAPGEDLGVRRVAEVYEAADILGVHRVEFLGYEDSGMIDEPSNENPDCFWQADVHEAATRLAAILQEEDADVFTIYDPNGGYGHPDHIQVHRVGTEAAELAGVSRVFWSTMNRDEIQRMMAENPEMAESMDDDREERVDSDSFGMPEADITHAIDVTAALQAKRDAMASHASQISQEDFFLTLPEDAFAGAFGTEWYVAPGWPRNGGEFISTLFA
jgi:LmbE family N-acetylglucosaminyl deacetylase